MSFVFYDTETTGTNTAFDQILQFAAIRTDHDFKELDRFEIRCRLLPYVVPSPGAMRVTGVTVAQITDPALPSHYQMMRAIKTKFEKWSPAVFIGHNSLGFDEHLLRQGLYQTLYAPYLTNTNGNCRSDSLRIVQAVSLFAPNTLSVPVDHKGRSTFKLDRLAPANGFNHSAAHDAMGDVEAMIHICRILAERESGLWSNFVRFAQKAAVLDFAMGEDVFSLTDFYFSKPYSWIVSAIAPNPDNGSELLVYDLSIDPGELTLLTDDDLVERLAERPKPVRGLRTNACPIVLSYDEMPDHLRSRAPNLAELRRRAASIKSDPAFSERLIAAYVRTRERKEPSVHVEEQIYDSFTGNGDYAVLARFHEVHWRDRAALLAGLSDKRLPILGQRLIYAEAPEVMSAQDRNNIEVAIARRLMAVEGTVPWLTLPKAIADTDDMLAIAASKEVVLLRDLRDYLTQCAEQAGKLVA